MASARPSLGSPTLLLLPTELERKRFLEPGPLEPGLALVRVAGFGPVAPAARTAQLLGELRPRRVLLAGIAGTYDAARHPVGSALVFGEAAIDGVGAGAGEGFLGPRALGFPQWPGGHGAVPEVVDRLPLHAGAGGESAPAAGLPLLLTVCAASAGSGHAAERRERFPDAAAEDMEGFGVALACALHGVPLAVVRGISNEAGDRDRARWRVPAALAAARDLATRILEEEDWRACR